MARPLDRNPDMGPENGPGAEHSEFSFEPRARRRGGSRYVWMLEINYCGGTFLCT